MTVSVKLVLEADTGDLRAVHDCVKITVAVSTTCQEVPTAFVSQVALADHVGAVIEMWTG